MQNLARRIVQRLEVTSGSRVWLTVGDPGLKEAIASILGVSGATVLEEPDGEITAAVLRTETLETTLLPESLTEDLERVPPGARVVVAVASPSTSQSVEAFAQHQGRRLGLLRSSGYPSDAAVILRGERRRGPKGTKLRALRGIGHGMAPSVLVGRSGLTAELVAQVESALERHGIVKVKLTPQCDLDKREAAKALAWATGSELVQRVGKTALLWREDIELDPPTKQSKRR